MNTAEPNATSQAPRRSRRLTVILTVAAGAALLAVLVAFTPWRLLAMRAIQVPWPGWIAAALGMSVTYALRAGRLRAEWAWKLKALGLGYRECLQITLLHNAAINLLPMRSGEASYAFLLHRRWGVGLGEAAASLLWLRLQDLMVLGVLGLAALLPLPLPVRLGVAAGAALFAATVVPAGVRRIHVHARWARARAHASRTAPARRRLWHGVAKVAGAFRAARGGLTAWGYAIANWVLKLGVVAALLGTLAALPPAASWCAALGGELAAVIPLQAPAGVGTYEAGVALGSRVRTGDPADAERPAPKTDNPPDDNGRLIFGAALAVHALMVVVALGTAFVFSLWVRRSNHECRDPEVR